MRLKPGSFFYNLFFLFANEYESFNGRILPNKSLRTGGEEFQDNEFFVQSAHSEAEKLITHLVYWILDVVMPAWQLDYLI